MRIISSAGLFGLALTAALSAPSAAWAAEGPAPLPPSVKIKPLLVPVIAAGRIERYTQFEVMLEVGDATRLGEVQVKLPKLHDAILSAVYHGVGEGWIVRGNIANLPALRRMIDESNTKLMGKDVITRIMITPVARQSSLP
ncbi:hypothetical protein [Azospirillum sp. SYSU D00513]|uniref:hypothetical protein n=1 Tax=Azospirillum sp. SYSU D00513 TaxID=2812561 RepID=UPI001A97570B|nr:hypothetical protein [Azospirillum sp. SYSU D00513]